MTPLIHDHRARKLSFTGSTAVGQTLLREAADQVLRVSMELGGNAPFVVFDDADLDAAVDGAMIAKLRNMGQSCVAANRFLVHRSVADEFTHRLAARFERLTVGRGMDEVDIGPLIDARACRGVQALVDDARQGGAVAVVGGDQQQGPGHFYPPTVLAEVPDQALLLSTEIFGPVAPIQVFDDEDEAVGRANDTVYGLVAYAYTRDLARALRVGERLDVGMVGLNRGAVSNPAAPFGGVKHSGLGREGGPEGLEDYLATRYLAIDA